jgi:putative ABC transport system substrate-binding protein
MNRRGFISVLGGAAVWPVAAAAQESMPVIGFLNHGSPEATAHFVAAFRKGLGETGYVEGANVAIDYRWAQNDIDRLPELAADLVRRRVSVIATPVSAPASFAAKAATTHIPIVFGTGTDPVQAGLVTSFNRPGGNVTGVSGLNWELGAKRLGLLHEVAAEGGPIALLVNPNFPTVVEPFLNDVKSAADAIGRSIDVVHATNRAEIDTAFVTLRQKQAAALMVTPDALFLTRRVQLVALTLRHGVPTIYPWRDAVDIGGLMSYSTSLLDVFRQVGIYTGRVLKGEKAADLPILRASKFEFVINVQTAKTLGIEISGNLLSLADEVIE